MRWHAKTTAVVIINIDFGAYLKINICHNYKKPSKYPKVSVDYTIYLDGNATY